MTFDGSKLKGFYKTHIRTVIVSLFSPSFVLAHHPPFPYFSSVYYLPVNVETASSTISSVFEVVSNSLFRFVCLLPHTASLCLFVCLCVCP